eukprot:2366863-Rhodomonas_salina.1
MGQLNFFPRALIITHIEEIYTGGATLEDIATGSKPFRPVSSELEAIGRGLEGQNAAVLQAVSEQAPQ